MVHTAVFDARARACRAHQAEQTASLRAAGGGSRCWRGLLWPLLASAVWLSACAREGARTAYPRSGPTPPAWTRDPPRARALPKGSACLEQLRRQGVRFKPLKSLRGVATPVELTGALHGVSFRTRAGQNVVGDCRLALALDQVAWVLTRWGIDRAEHFGAYSYRNTRGGRLSLHAKGLAIDVSGFSVPRARPTPALSLSVQRDFKRRLGDGCNPHHPVLNQLACQLRGLQLFRELITPDHDSDHDDHFHLALPP